jgi:hypothetical protein
MIDYLFLLKELVLTIVILKMIILRYFMVEKVMDLFLIKVVCIKKIPQTTNHTGI